MDGIHTALRPVSSYTLVYNTGGVVFCKSLAKACTPVVALVFFNNGSAKMYTDIGGNVIPITPNQTFVVPIPDNAYYAKDIRFWFDPVATLAECNLQLTITQYEGK